MISPCRWMKMHRSKMDRHPEMNPSVLRDILQLGFDGSMGGNRCHGRFTSWNSNCRLGDAPFTSARANYIGNYGLFWVDIPIPPAIPWIFVALLVILARWVGKQYPKVSGCLGVGYLARVCHSPRRNYIVVSFLQ